MNSKEGTIIGGIIFSVIMFVLEEILKDAFYKSLCSISNFGCIVGFIAYKLPLVIVILFWSRILWKHFKE